MAREHEQWLPYWININEEEAYCSALLASLAGSTIAGNFLILGAASNVIIIQNAERKHGKTPSFWEFARVGVPLTLVNVPVYWIFIRLLRSPRGYISCAIFLHLLENIQQSVLLLNNLSPSETNYLAG